jgi:hypothetical protein
MHKFVGLGVIGMEHISSLPRYDFKTLVYEIISFNDLKLRYWKLLPMH